MKPCGMSHGPKAYDRATQAAYAGATSPISRWCRAASSSPPNCAASSCATGPRIVAVELPGSLEDAYLQALARLPEMSVILYPDPEDEERGIYVPVEPCDPFTEAVRTALEIDAEVVFHRARYRRPAPSAGHLSGPLRDSATSASNKYIEAYRVYPQVRDRGSGRARRGHGLEAARRRSAGASSGGGFAEHAGPAAGRHGSAAGRAALQPARPKSAC